MDPYLEQCADFLTPYAFRSKNLTTREAQAAIGRMERAMREVKLEGRTLRVCQVILSNAK